MWRAVPAMLTLQEREGSGGTKKARPGAGHSRDSIIGCMTSRSEAPSKFQVPKSAGLLSATRLPLYALISRARKNGGGGHIGERPMPDSSAAADRLDYWIRRHA